MDAPRNGAALPPAWPFLQAGEPAAATGGVWEVHDFAFDASAMVRSQRVAEEPLNLAHVAEAACLAAQLGARLETAADEALLPLLAPRVVSVSPPEAEEADDAAAAGASNANVGPQRTRRRAAERGNARRPAVCRVSNCAEPLGADAHPYCFRCALPIKQRTRSACVVA